MTSVACIGECMIELKQAERGLFSRGYGGDTLNTAVYLARLGTGADYITALGDDTLSDEDDRRLGGRGRWHSVSYGVATAAKSHSIGLGTRVLMLEDGHSSPVLEWQVRTEAQGFTVETIKRPGDGDWTSAVLASIERAGAPPVSLASISSVHWSDGGLIDVEKIGAALRIRLL